MKSLRLIVSALIIFIYSPSSFSADTATHTFRVLEQPDGLLFFDICNESTSFCAPLGNKNGYSVDSFIRLRSDLNSTILEESGALVKKVSVGAISGCLVAGLFVASKATALKGIKAFVGTCALGAAGMGAAAGYYSSGHATEAIWNLSLRSFNNRLIENPKSLTMKDIARVEELLYLVDQLNK